MENLIATAANPLGNEDPWTVERVLEIFPELGERASSMGNLLSGGEQQMLAIGRALMTNPKLLILDEATEGLAPVVRHRIWQALAEIRQGGLSILAVDKNLHDLVKLADVQEGADIFPVGGLYAQRISRPASVANERFSQIVPTPMSVCHNFRHKQIGKDCQIVPILSNHQ